MSGGTIARFEDRGQPIPIAFSVGTSWNDAHVAVDDPLDLSSRAPHNIANRRARAARIGEDATQWRLSTAPNSVP